MIVPGNRLSSVSNAARLLKAFTSANPTWGVSDLARHAGVNKSTVHRILSTLTDEGLLEQDPDSGRYRVGLVMFDLAAAVPTQRGLHEAVLSPMTDLRNTTGETVHVAVLDGREVVYVERLDSPNTLRLFAEIGRRNDAHCTSTGKVLLAFSPPDRRQQLLKNWELPARTDHTITSIERLAAELDEIRRTGHAVNRHESEIGVTSIAAPIKDQGAVTVAAISVAGPSERIDSARTQFTNAVVDAAMTASRRLGYGGGAQ